MDPRPPPAIGTRTASGGLTLTVHGLLVMVLLNEDRDLVRPLPASRTPAQVWIHLASIHTAPPPGAPGRSETSPLPLRPIAPRARAIGPTPPSTPQPPGSTEGEAVPSPLDWELMAQQRAGAYGREEDRTTFGERLAKIRRPCIAQPLGNTIVGTNRRSVDTSNKSSFKWKWDDTSKGGIGALTPGWEKLPAYDGMFDDMQAGKTPGSSVPDPDFCD